MTRAAAAELRGGALEQQQRFWKTPPDRATVPSSCSCGALRTPRRWPRRARCGSGRRRAPPAPRRMSRDRPARIVRARGASDGPSSSRRQRIGALLARRPAASSSTRRLPLVVHPGGCPQIAATASNSRPALVVGGEPTRPATAGRVAPVARVDRRGEAVGQRRSVRRAAASQAQAIRHGSRDRRVAAGQRHRRRAGRRARSPARSPTRSSPPQIVAVGRRSRRRRRSRPSAGPGLGRARRGRRRGARGGAGPPTQLEPRRARARTGGEVVGMEVVRDELAARPRRGAGSARCPSPKERSVSKSSRSPMWWLDPGAAALARQKVLFSSAPQREHRAGASTGSADRRRRVAARAPQQQRSPPATGRSTESSVRDVDRAVVGEEAGRRSPPSRSQRVVVAVGDRLVGEVAAGHHQRHARRRRAAGGAAASRAASAPSSARAGRDRRSPPRRRRGGERGRSGARGRPSSAASRRASSSHQRPRGVEVGDHQRERLVLAMLARAQRGHGRLVVGAGRPGGSRRGP